MVNLPIPENLGAECKKAARTLRSFRMPESNEGPDKMIPVDIIEKAKGLVILTVVKAGFLFSGRVGFGLVVTRLSNGSWSAPSAIGTGSFGAGLQIGAELTDFIIILNNDRAVEAFMGGGNVALGGNISVAAGPIGRNAEASGMATIAAVYSYSKTKGIFAGISLEGTVFVERSDTNEKFYGKKIKAREILAGMVDAPPEAQILYDAIYLRESVSNDDTRATHASTDVNRSQSVRNSTAGRPQPVPQNRPTPPPPVSNKPKAKALYDFVPQQPGDLGFKTGDIIDITEKTQSQNDWWKGSINGKSGSFPANYVQML